MTTLLKWPGGKENELDIIRAFIPAYKGRYVEPFVGGGAVFFDVDNKKYCINDKSEDLIRLYRCVQSKNSDFIMTTNQFIREFSILKQFMKDNKSAVVNLCHLKITVDAFLCQFKKIFTAISLKKNDVFMQELEKNLKGKTKRFLDFKEKKEIISERDRIDSIEAALKSAYYMYIRYFFNHGKNLAEGEQAAIFFFIREYCYSSMFRYNQRGEFNVPYGGISYNQKDLTHKVEYLLSEKISEKLKKTDIFCEDFEVFLNSLKLTKDDFVFLDPPYDSDFSTYAKNIFDKKDQIRLCTYLKQTPAQVMMVIKNTDFIYNLYKDNFNMTSFDKKYFVSFKNRNNREVEHLIITNY